MPSPNAGGGSQTDRCVAPETRGDALFRTAFEQGPVGICLVGPDLRFLEVNGAYSRLLGYVREELVGRPFTEFTHPEDAERDADLARSLFAGEIPEYQIDKRYLTKTGRIIWVNLTAALIRDADGNIAHGIGLVQDITLRKIMEDRLNAKNEALELANRHKHQFFSNMSHEFRTPLASIVGFGEMLSSEAAGPITERQSAFLARILASARHLVRLIDDVLDFAKAEAGRLEVRSEHIDPRDVVSEVRDMLHPQSSEKDVEIHVELDPALQEVVTDPVRLRQILFNYLSNAVKFTPNRGRITVSVSRIGRRFFRVGVKDTGIGIAPEDVGRLFVEFQQLDAGRAKHFQGTGLGLALTKQLVEAQGGRVGVDSAPGAGSTFWAILPDARDAAPCTAHSVGAETSWPEASSDA